MGLVDRAILFDLDDTLYDEREFVRSALRDVASFVAERSGINADELHIELQEILDAEGRGAVFDQLLQKHRLPKSWVEPMLYVYRTCIPSLDLFPDAAVLLQTLREQRIRTGIVTDGASLVQANKVRALRLESLIDVIVYTDSLGAGASKPATVGFEVALELLNAEPEGSFYIANDVRKDFVAPRRLGMSGILVSRRMLGVLEGLPPSHQPDHVVWDMADLLSYLDLDGEPANMRDERHGD